MDSEGKYFLNNQTENVRTEEQNVLPEASSREAQRRSARSTRRIKGFIITATVVLAVLIRGMYYTRKLSVTPPEAEGQISPESSSEGSDESISSGEEPDPGGITEYDKVPSQHTDPASQDEKPEPGGGSQPSQPKGPAVPTKKIYEMKLEPEEYERPKSADSEWKDVWLDESNSVYKDKGYKAAETFSRSRARRMFEKIVLFGGTMELRRPSPKPGQEGLTFMVTATPEPWLTEEELKTHPLGPLRKELAPLAVGYVEDAIQELTESLDSSTVYNPFKEVDIDGYGKVLIQLAKDQQHIPVRPHPRLKNVAPPPRSLRTEITFRSAEDAAEEIETTLKTGRGVLVCHLPGVDVGVVINQPEGVDQAVPILNEEMDGDELDFFRQTLEETIAEFVQTTSKVSNHYKVIRITQSQGVPKTTVVSLFGIAK